MYGNFTPHPATPKGCRKYMELHGYLKTYIGRAKNWREFPVDFTNYPVYFTNYPPPFINHTLNYFGLWSGGVQIRDGDKELMHAVVGLGVC